ncbi:MAG: hypothetical protein H0U67_15150, partial [Gemmatimonadetes bacterium]|nr:hypothetical protein [Gemmatimonadota bacterium]
MAGEDTRRAAMNRAERGGLLAAALVAGPVLIGLAYAVLGAADLTGVGASGRASFARILSVLSQQSVWRGTAWTLWVALSSTVIATVGAIVLAVSFRSTASLDRVARTLAIVPLPIPHVVAGVMGVLI